MKHHESNHTQATVTKGCKQFKHKGQQKEKLWSYSKTHIALYSLNHKSQSSKAGVRRVSGCFDTLVSSVTHTPHHLEDSTQTLANKQNKELCENSKMQIAMSNQGRLLSFGREGTVEMETVLGEICARLPSVHQRVRGKSSHSGRTWRREWRRKRHYFFQMV